MGGESARSMSRAAWALARRQHGVITRRQLLRLAYSRHAIDHRIETGRLHRVWRGVYAVGRPELTREGHLMAAVLACGDGAFLSHHAAADLWEIRPRRRAPLDVSVERATRVRRPGLRAHRRPAAHITVHRRIPVTTPIQTLIDLALDLDPEQLERAVNEAVNRDLTDPEELRRTLDAMPRQPGIRPLARLLDKHTFVLTDSILEQRMVRIARKAGLPKPKTQAHVNGFRVDFYWSDNGIVVEADSLRFHRTPAQQASDRLRDQTHTAAGLVPLRMTHWQIAREPHRLARLLQAVASR
jgi:very-short-patch-repair endonuclease